MSRDILELVRMRDLVAGGRVRHIREAAGLSLADVARECGCSRSAVFHWERGRVPRGTVAIRYARLLFELEELTRR